MREHPVVHEYSDEANTYMADDMEFLSATHWSLILYTFLVNCVYYSVQKLRSWFAFLISGKYIYSQYSYNQSLLTLYTIDIPQNICIFRLFSSPIKCSFTNGSFGAFLTNLLFQFRNEPERHYLSNQYLLIIFQTINHIMRIRKIVYFKIFVSQFVFFFRTWFHFVWNGVSSLCGCKFYDFSESLVLLNFQVLSISVHAFITRSILQFPSRFGGSLLLYVSSSITWFHLPLSLL